jgi:hypothetical protein
LACLTQVTGPHPYYANQQIDIVIPFQSMPSPAAATAAAGHEPEYTSSHSLFMDTCDYVFYDANPVILAQQQQQQQQQQTEAPISYGSAAAAGADDGSSDSSDSSGDDEDSSTPAAAAAVAQAGQSSYGYELQPVAVLLPPDGMKLTKGLPSRWLGSDHVCLVVDFELSLANKAL